MEDDATAAADALAAARSEAGAAAEALRRELAALQASAAGSAAAAAAAEAAKVELTRKLAVVVKELKTQRGVREAEEAAKAGAVAAAEEARLAAEALRGKLAACERAKADAAAGWDAAAARVEALGEELREVRTSLAETNATRRFLEERAEHLEADFRERLSGAREAAANEALAKAAEFGGWEEWVAPEGDAAPPPIATIEHPVVGELLRSYTKSATEQVELWTWLKAVAGDKDVRNQPRLDFQRAPSEVKDNFRALAPREPRAVRRAQLVRSPPSPSPPFARSGHGGAPFEDAARRAGESAAEAAHGNALRHPRARGNGRVC
jgi:hypothetical protein